MGFQVESWKYEQLRLRMGVVLLTIATEHGEGRKEVLSSGKCRLRKNARIYDVKSRKEDRTLETE